MSSSTYSIAGYVNMFITMFSLRSIVVFNERSIVLSLRINLFVQSCLTTFSRVSSILMHFYHFGAQQQSRLIQSNMVYCTQCQNRKSASLLWFPLQSRLNEDSATSSSYLYSLQLCKKKARNPIINEKRPPAYESSQSSLPTFLLITNFF